MNNKFGLLIAITLAALMAACSPAASQPTEEAPTEEPTIEVTDQPTEAPEVEETSEPADEMPGSEIPHPAVLEAQLALAEHLGVDMADLTLVSAEQVEWTDGCLGLGGAEELCMQALVPGWRVIFSADGTEYEVRTDETGASVRINLGGVAPSAPTE